MLCNPSTPYLYPMTTDRPLPPPGHFQLEEIQTLRSFEYLTLSGIDYYLWVNESQTGAGHFLLALELRFESGPSLLLSSGEDSEGISVSSPEQLLEMASRLFQLNGKPVVQRLKRDEHPFWQPYLMKQLKAVRLSRSDEGLYLNDALLLDFGGESVLVSLRPEQEGLSISVGD